MKSRCGHRRFSRGLSPRSRGSNTRSLSWLLRRAVGRCASVEVDRLGADDDERCAVVGKILKSVEQHGTGSDEQVSVASRAH